MRILKWFVAGFLAVPLGHQVVLWILHAIAFTDRAAFGMEATKPFGVPSLISLSFWGGVWGILLGLFLDRVLRGRWFWLAAGLFGAIAPTLVAGLVVAPLKGMSVAGNPRLAILGLLVNLTWGLATAALFRVMSQRNS